MTIVKKVTVKEINEIFHFLKQEDMPKKEDYCQMGEIPENYEDEDKGYWDIVFELLLKGLLGCVVYILS